MIQLNEFTPTRQYEGLMGDAEAAGFRNAILAGLDVLAPLYAARTEVGMKFDGEKEGPGAAHRCVVAVKPTGSSYTPRKSAQTRTKE